MATAVVAVALLPAGTPQVAIVAGAIAAGISQPPVGACMRALWPELLDTPDRRHAAYALEGVAIELVYICGPVVIVASIGSWSLRAALVACAAAVLGGDLAFSAHPVSRGLRPHRDRARDLTGAPADAPRRLALLVAAWSAAHAALGLAATPLALALVLLVAGASIAPTFVCANRCSTTSRRPAR